MRRALVFVSVVIITFFAQRAWGAMSSTNYYIYADVISVGGVLSTSSAYSLQDTAGEPFAGFVTSSSYEIKGGYQAMEQDELSLSISDSALSLGSLVNYTASSTVSTNISVDSGSAGGFSLSISGVTGSILADVSDGAVDGDGSSEEYGIGVVGANAAFADDRSVVLGRVLASSTVSVVSNTVLTFKAIRNASTAPNTYSQSVTLVASANF